MSPGLYDRDEELERIRAAWNAAIPSQKTRRWIKERRRNALAGLQAWTVEEIIEGIVFYGNAPWQKKHQWMSFDRWLEERELTTWVDKALNDAEAKAARVPPKDERVRQRTEAIAELHRIRSEREEDNARYDALSPEEQGALLTQAAADLNSAGKGRQLRARADIGVVKQRALTILKARLATQPEKTPNPLKE